MDTLAIDTPWSVNTYSRIKHKSCGREIFLAKNAYPGAPIESANLEPLIPGAYRPIPGAEMICPACCRYMGPGDLEIVVDPSAAAYRSLYPPQQSGV